MPVPLQPGDRKLLIGAGAALIVLVLLALKFAPAPEQEPDELPSSYSASSSGAKAAYLLLEELGYKIERWQMPPSELPQDVTPATLVLVQPFFPASSEDVTAIHQFLSRGGTVLAIGVLAAEMMPQGKALIYELPGAARRKFHPAMASPLSRGAPEIVMVPSLKWDGRGADHLAVFAEGGNAVVVTYPYGRGRVIWWGSATPLANSGIREANNLDLLLNSIGPPGERRVLWDEFFHGQRGSIWTYFARTPIPWGVAQCGVLALALFFTFGRRSGPVRTLPPESRLAPLEFVETLGDLYHRAHAASSAVGIEYQRFRYLVSRRAGVPPSASVEQLHEAVRERLGWREPGLFETLQRAERAMRDPGLNDKEALAIAQALEQYEDLWQLKPRATEEKRAWRNK